MSLQKELIENDILLSIFSKPHYNRSVFKLLKGLEGKKICYVTLNKTAANLESSLRMHRFKTNNLFFIDAVSKSKGLKNKDNAIFVSSPNSLQELSMAIKPVLACSHFDALLFDSLSTLKFSQTEEIEKFNREIINQVRAQGKQGIFTCLEEDSSLFTRSFQHVDKILHPQAFQKRKFHPVLPFMGVMLVLTGLLWFASSGDLTGASILQYSGEPNILLMFSGMGAFALVFFIGTVLYKKHSLHLISDEELEQIQPGNLHDNLKSKFKQKLLSWINKVDN